MAETDEPGEGTHLRDHGVRRARGTGKETVCGTGPTNSYIPNFLLTRCRAQGTASGWRAGAVRLVKGHLPLTSILDLIVHQVTRHSLLVRQLESHRTVTHEGFSLPSIDYFVFAFILTDTCSSLRVTLGSHLISDHKLLRGQCNTDTKIQAL